MAMTMEYFFLSGRASPDEPRECPMIRCRQRFEDARCMIQHLKVCDRLKEGELWCPCCHTCQRFNVVDRSHCSWKRETLSRKLENGVRRISNTIQRKCSGAKVPDETQRLSTSTSPYPGATKITNQHGDLAEMNGQHSERLEVQSLSELPCSSPSSTLQELSSNSEPPTQPRGVSPASHLHHASSTAAVYSTVQQLPPFPTIRIPPPNSAQRLQMPYMPAGMDNAERASPLAPSSSVDFANNNEMIGPVQDSRFRGHANQAERPLDPLPQLQASVMPSIMQDFDVGNWSNVRDNFAQASTREPQYDRHLTESPGLMDEDLFAGHEGHYQPSNMQHDLVQFAHGPGTSSQPRLGLTYPCGIPELDTSHTYSLGSEAPVDSTLR